MISSTCNQPQQQSLFIFNMDTTQRTKIPSYLTSQQTTNLYLEQITKVFDTTETLRTTQGIENIINLPHMTNVIQKNNEY